MPKSVDVTGLQNAFAQLGQSNARYANLILDRRRREQAKTSGLFRTAGSIIGGIYGGPAGASAGGAVGGLLAGDEITPQEALSVGGNFAIQSQQEQARVEWVFAEPSWAMGLAAVKKLKKQWKFKKDDIIVCIANWNWLKDPKSPLWILAEPASIEPDFEEIERFIEQKLYAIHENSGDSSSKVIFSKKPNKSEVNKAILSEFWVKTTSSLQGLCLKEICNFIDKWKSIKKSDLQYIIEESLNEIYLKEKVLEIIDFKIETWLHAKAEAEVKAKAFWEEITIKVEWVWPVDASIKALKKGLRKLDPLEVNLIDYEVYINSKWVDSSVAVKMTLTDNSWNKAVAKTTSPDVIVASIMAFEKWFNILHWKSKNK